MISRRLHAGYPPTTPGLVWPPLIVLALFFCWNAPTCNCQGFPATSFVYEVQRGLYGAYNYTDYVQNWMVVAEDIPETCFQDILDPPVGKAFWYRTFAKAPNGTYCCEEGG